MHKKDRLDAFGVSALFAVALLLAFNQIIVKWVNAGLQPVFFAGARSALAILFVGGWLWWRGRPPVLRREHLVPGLLIGTVFAAEFLCLFLALDLTAVSRAAVIFYSMPVWFSLMAHFLLPGERLTWVRATGLALAFSGTALAIATTVTSAPSRAVRPTPKGMRYSSSETSSFMPHSGQASKVRTGSSMSTAMRSRPLASDGLAGTMIFRPGTFMNIGYGRSE